MKSPKREPVDLNKIKDMLEDLQRIKDERAQELKDMATLLEEMQLEYEQKLKQTPRNEIELSQLKKNRENTKERYNITSIQYQINATFVAALLRLMAKELKKEGIKEFYDDDDY